MYKIVKKTKYGWTKIARKLKVFNRRFSTENEEKFNIAIDEKLKVDDEDPNEIYVNKKLMNANLNYMSVIFYISWYFNHDITYWDVSSVTDMSWMFYWTDYFNQDLSGWDVSNVNNMN